MSLISSLKKQASRSVKEILLHVRRQRLTRSDDQPRVVIFPSSGGAGGPSGLRAIAIGEELNRRGWRAVVVPSVLSLAQRKRILWLERPDVILLQQSRHPLNRPWLYPDYPCVLDADDMDIIDPRIRDEIIKCLRGCVSAIAGSHGLAERFEPYNENVSVVWTATSITEPEVTDQADRKPVVAWAHSSPLGYPIEARMMLEVMLRLKGQSQTPFEFWLYGVSDEAAVRDFFAPAFDAGVSLRLLPPMDYADFIDSLGRVAVGLHPVCIENEYSQGKSFGKLLAYLAARAAIVTTHAVDHPYFFDHERTGLLLKNDPDDWCAAIKTLLANPARRATMVEAAHHDFMDRLTTPVSAALTDEALTRAIALGKDRSR